MDNSSHGLIQIPDVPRSTHKSSFLKSVQWLFSYQAMGKDFVEDFRSKLVNSGFKVDEEAQEMDAVSVHKDGYWVLANNALMVLTVSGSDYIDYDSFLPKITVVLEILSEIGVTKISMTVCIKRNFFEIEKTKAPLKKEDILKRIFSEQFLNMSKQNDSLLCRTSDCSVFLQRTMQETVTKATVELTVESIYSGYYDVIDALPKLEIVNASCYSSWHYAMSKDMISILDK